MFRGLAIAAAAALVAAAGPACAQPYQGGYWPGMMGGQGWGSGAMMGAGAFNRPVYAGWGGGVLDYAAVQSYIRQGDEIGQADPKTDTVSYEGQDVTIDLVAVQPGHDDQTFEVHGLTNPTLVVPLGARVRLNLVNMDYGNDMEHGVILTPSPPPYPYMAMMATGPGLAAIMPLLPWRNSETITAAQYAFLGVSFVAERAGTYWYVCPTPGHAEEGMFGKLIIR